ncbi:hypothetical protein [Anaeromyxobacter terrae]|uniref:hypothetical protein n=1 Tax=Anaeromyxobacter terrae TaxID=2925406 RepID=UPI001F57F020|nr:hypothetical protein [Anaeromyxobacter sp. SG22]
MSPDRTPEYLVERLHAGDLPPDEAERVRRRLAAEGGERRLHALAREDAAFRDAHPPGPALAEIRRRAALGAPAPRRARRPLLLVPVAAAVAVASVVVLRAVSGPVAPVEDTRLKGLSARLEVHRSRGGDGAEELRDGAVAREGDLLQLSYVAAGRRFGAVVSVDGRGIVTLHWPEDGGPAAALAQSGAVPLPHAYLLDDAPAFERFFLVTADAPFDTATVVEAARRLAAAGRARQDPLPLPAGLNQHALLLRKPEEPR